MALHQTIAHPGRQDETGARSAAGRRERVEETVEQIGPWTTVGIDEQQPFRRGRASASVASVVRRAAGARFDYEHLRGAIHPEDGGPHRIAPAIVDDHELITVSPAHPRQRSETFTRLGLRAGERDHHGDRGAGSCGLGVARYLSPVIATTVSVIVVNHQRADLLLDCLRSIAQAVKEVPGTTETIVVDNGSGDDSCDRVRREHPDVVLIELSENRGFATAVGAAAEKASGDWLLLLNNDATIEVNAIADLVAVGVSAPDIGSLAAQLRFAHRPPRLNSAGIEVDALGVSYDRLLGLPLERSEASPTEVFGASGGAALYRRAMLEQIGGFDRSFFVFMEDADVAWRARMAGWRCLYVPSAVVHHHHSATARHRSAFKHLHVGRNRVRLVAKNMDSRALARRALGMIVYDLAYVTFHVAVDRTLAPLRGRLLGLRDWRHYRRIGAPTRRPIPLAPSRGLRAAARRRASYLAGRNW